MSSNYACPCLNVHFRARQPPSPYPFLPLSDSHYQPVYVGQDGIAIVHTLPSHFVYLFNFLVQVHPQLTLRTRTHPKPQSDSEHLLRRHTSLTCLICRLSVYRVLQFIPPDMDVTDGPILPTEEWVEHEVLQSGSGWIELATQCLVSPLIFSSRYRSMSLVFSSIAFICILLTCQFLQRQMSQWPSHKPLRPILPFFAWYCPRRPTLFRHRRRRRPHPLPHNPPHQSLRSQAARSKCFPLYLRCSHPHHLLLHIRHSITCPLSHCSGLTNSENMPKSNSRK